MRTLCLFALTTALCLAQPQDYTGPVPAKADVPYLLHASNLIEIEPQEAHEEAKKNETLYWVDGAAAKVRTPLAEPIFIIRVVGMKPEKMELYRFNVKKDRRELTIKERPGRGEGPLHVSVIKVGKDLWRVEASEQLENGEYSLSPQGSNQVFSFQVY